MGALLFDHSSDSIIYYALIGLYQLFSFITISWFASNWKLRLPYVLLLIPVFAADAFGISRETYFYVLCPIVMFYYFIVCIVEVWALHKAEQVHEG
jgi:hypothetical protein